MKKIHLHIISLLVCCYVSSSIVSPVQAQNASLSINPPVVEILLAPNKQVNQTFTIHVDGESFAVIPDLHLVKPQGNEGHSQIDLTPLTPSEIPLVIKSSLPLGKPYPIDPARPDLQITLTLESATLDLAEDVYLALVVRVVPLESSISNLSSSSLPAISALILTTINPTGVMPIGLEIQNFALPLIHDTWLPFTVAPELKNSVDQMIRPVGKYEIITPTGTSIFARELYPNLILGNSTRLLQGTEPCKNEQGSVPCNPTPLIFTPKWSDLGPHRIRLIVTTQSGTKLTEVERTVWFLPIRLIILISSLIIFSLGLYLRHRRYHVDP